MLVWRAVAGLAAGVTLLSACSSGLPDLDLQAISAGVAASDIPARDARLAPATWEQTAAWVLRETDAGHPVVVNLFGSWCEPCRAEAPLLRAAIAAHPDVHFLLVDTRDGIVPGEQFLIDEGLLDVPSLFDPEGLVFAGLQGRGMPTTAFFSADGSLVNISYGILTEPALAQALADLEATIDRS
ncbi:MAG: thiol-disulfide isomerase/thioredoxin [Glaciecola sp.]|jgi:thiol-disulfide isomerase/thioredoxin